jgi:hypothetical protein
MLVKLGRRKNRREISTYLGASIFIVGGAHDFFTGWVSTLADVPALIA